MGVILEQWCNVDWRHASTKIFVRLAGTVVSLYLLLIFGIIVVGYLRRVRIRLGSGDRTRGRRWAQTLQRRCHSNDVSVQKFEKRFLLIVRDSVILALVANGPFDILDAFQSSNLPTEPNTGLFHEFSVSLIWAVLSVPGDDKLSVLDLVEVELEVFFHVMPSLWVMLHKTIIPQNFSSTVSRAASLAFFAHVVGNVDLVPSGDGFGSRCVVKFSGFDFRLGVGPVSVAVVQIVVGRDHDGVVRSLDDHECGLHANRVVRIPPATPKPFVLDPSHWIGGGDGAAIQNFFQEFLSAIGPPARNLGICFVVEVYHVGCVLGVGAKAHFPGDGSDRSTDQLRSRLPGIVRFENHAPRNLDDVFSGLDGVCGVNTHRTARIAGNITAQFQLGSDESVLGSRYPIEDGLCLLEMCIFLRGHNRCEIGCCHQGQR
mmetsp:Transcript_16999/g.46681  ORF Transcript_16999/g.46681 Transcript_16999/m.46681 type:complete len:429 (-) Transcript_16999:329-1615(-)